MFMNLSYRLFLLTFLVYPFIGLTLSRTIPRDRIPRLINGIITFFLIHNVLFALGFSLKGDNIDYLIFSTEYLFLCYFVFCLKSKNLYAKTLKVIGMIGLGLGGLVGMVGILLFIVVSQDYDADKIFHFESSGNGYETRRYSYGFATLEDVCYTFDTYREYGYLPFEKKIDQTVFFDNKTNLNIDNALEIDIHTSNNKRRILFKDIDGNVFSKLLD